MTRQGTPGGRTRVAVVHLLPVEYYPPAINALRHLAASGGLDLALFTVRERTGRTAFACDGVTVRRFEGIPGAGGVGGRFVRHFAQARGTRAGLRRFRPDAILYYEPHSAVPVAEHLRSDKAGTRLCVHHHEYYAPADFLRRGLRRVRRAYEREGRELLPRAAWISQTNADRLRLFRDDHPAVRGDAWRVLPNYPPASWQGAWRRRSPRRSADEPLRCVYVGSVSLEDTHVRSLCDWVRARRGRVTLDLHGYKTPKATVEWLNGLGDSCIRFFPAGVEYDRLPALLPGYEVGVILHRGCTPNYVHNTPNKLFEYQTCGLEVWVPREMKGCIPFLQERHAPRVRCVDFGRLRDWDVEAVCAGLMDEASPPPRYCCEDVLAPLRDVLAGGGPAGS